MQQNLCSVCCYPYDGKIRCGALTCSACKSFFIRMQRAGPENLKCSRGTIDCKLEPTFSNNGADGRQIRQICPKCRYSKCVGMKMGYKKRYDRFIDQHHDRSNMALVKQPSCPHIVQDDILNRLAENFSRLTFSTEQIPGRKVIYSNPNEIISCFLTNYQSMAKAVSQYGRSFNAFSSTNLQDRCRIFMKIVNRIVCLLFSRFIDCTPLGFNPQNFALVPVAFKDSIDSVNS